MKCPFWFIKGQNNLLYIPALCGLQDTPGIVNMSKDATKNKETTNKGMKTNTSCLDFYSGIGMAQ